MVKSIQDQRGFTLVELAVVMVIIGLLLAGILKAQEMIANTRVTSTISQIKAIDAATTTFRDMFRAIPGDMANADDRLPNCTDWCDNSGAANGNGVLDALPNGATNGAAEARAFFIHLMAADLLTGVRMGGAVGAWGDTFPETPITGVGLHATSSPGGAGAGFPAAVNVLGARNGIYLVLTTTPGDAPLVALTPSQAFRIDSKLDDGNAETGSVRSTTGDDCAAAGGAYIESLQAIGCTTIARIQG